jgi:rhodanese-related sulfurtransferase
VALALRKLGVVRVRPLAGGLEGWRERGYPMTALGIPVSGQS